MIYHKESHKNITVCHKPHTLLQWDMRVDSISRFLQRHLSTIFTPHHHHEPKPPTEPPITQRHDEPPITQWHDVTIHKVDHHQYTYWLTRLHSGNFRDIPLMEVSVEGGRRFKHCRKKKDRLHSQSTNMKKRWKNPDQNTVSSQRRLTFFKLHSSLHQPKPRVNLLESR